MLWSSRAFYFHTFRTSQLEDLRNHFFVCIFKWPLSHRRHTEHHVAWLLLLVGCHRRRCCVRSRPVTAGAFLWELWDAPSFPEVRKRKRSLPKVNAFADLFQRTENCFLSSGLQSERLFLFCAEQSSGAQSPVPSGQGYREGCVADSAFLESRNENRRSWVSVLSLFGVGQQFKIHFVLLLHFM